MLQTFTTWLLLPVCVQGHTQIQVYGTHTRVHRDTRTGARGHTQGYAGIHAQVHGDTHTQTDTSTQRNMDTCAHTCTHTYTGACQIMASCWVLSDSVTPCAAARQASLSSTITRSLLKSMSIESVMLCNISFSYAPMKYPVIDSVAHQIECQKTPTQEVSFLLKDIKTQAGIIMTSQVAQW